MLIEEKEQEIVFKAQQNPAFFAPLYDHYFPKVYNYVYHRVNNTQLAEDLVAEIFYKALANIGSFKWQNRSFACWLYAIARNQVIDHFRRREPLLLDEGNTVTIVSKDDNPEEKVLQDVTREELLKAIGTLSPDQQDALLFRFREDLKIKEIASILNKNEGAVKALIFRGLKKLRKKLEGGEYSARL